MSARPPVPKALPAPRPTWLAPVGILGLALAVRALHLLAMHRSFVWDVLIGDARQYDAWARDIARGNWVGTQIFYQAPLYPYFLAVIFKVFGHSLLAVRAIQALLGAFSCLLLVGAGTAFFSMRVGLVAGLMMALYPPAVFYDFLLQKTALDFVLVTALVLLLGRLKQHPLDWRWLGPGLTLGALILTRENALLLIPLIILWIALQFRAQLLSRRVLAGALFIVGLSLALVPVGLRNLKVGGKFLVTTSQSGPNFYIGNHAGATGLYVPLLSNRGDAEVERHDFTAVAESVLGRALNPAEVSQYWWAQSLAFMRSQPLDATLLLLRKGFLVWNAHEFMDADSLAVHRACSPVLRLLGWFSFGVLFPLAVAGMWVTRAQWRRLWLLLAMAAVLLGTIVAFHVVARYRCVALPILMLFAAAGLCELVDAWRARKWGRLLPTAVLMLGTAALSHWPVINAAEELATAHFNFGIYFGRQGETPKAITQFREALQAFPFQQAAANNLAWIYATDPRAELRNGPEAVRLATQAARAADLREPNTLATLAAAFAENGQFEEAVRAAEQALAALPSEADAAAKEKFRQRISLYQSRQPYRTPLREPANLPTRHSSLPAPRLAL